MEGQSNSYALCYVGWLADRLRSVRVCACVWACVQVGMGRVGHWLLMQRLLQTPGLDDRMTDR